jgi:preprotein translocase subunit SecD
MSLFTRLSTLVGALLLTFQSMATMQGAEIHFNSSCDFKELTVNIRGEGDVNSDYVELNIKLQPAARIQLTQVSRNYMNQSLNMYINGIKINTATIRAELNTESIRIMVDKKVAKKIFPGLLATQCHQT